MVSAPRTAPTHLLLSLLSPLGGLSLWLVVWLVLGKPSPASACPHLCVCYPTPMTVSCQAQNFTAVPLGVPYESQRVFLQNNRITELRVGSFGFGTQVSGSVESSIDIFFFSVLFKNTLFFSTFKSEVISTEKNNQRSLKTFSCIRFCGFSPTTSRGLKQGPSVS